MSAVNQMDTLTPGRRADNGATVASLQTALSRSDTNLNLIPKLIARMAREGSYKEYTLGDSARVYRWNAAQFRQFIEAPRSEGGCETPLYVLERCLRGTDAWETFLELTRGEPGAQPGDVRNPHGSNQYTTAEEGINCDIIPVNPPADLPKPPPTGTSVSYTLRRLKRERPDLLERVKAGEISANAAAIEAGFREKQITIPADPRKAARRLVQHFTREQFSAMVDEAIGLYTNRPTPEANP